jgi:hypothetical protein
MTYILYDGHSGSWGLVNSSEALAAGTEPMTQILALAALYGHEDIVEILCTQGFDFDSFVFEKSSRYPTYDLSPADGELVIGPPLGIASKHGHESIRMGSRIISMRDG